MGAEFYLLKNSTHNKGCWWILSLIYKPRRSEGKIFLKAKNSGVHVEIQVNAIYTLLGLRSDGVWRCAWPKHRVLRCVQMLERAKLRKCV